MNFYKQKAVSDNLTNYGYLFKSEDTISISEWTNGEGYDIQITTNGHIENISLTEQEIDAIDYLIKTLRFKNEED